MVLLKLMYLKILIQDTKIVIPAPFWKVWFQNARFEKSGYRFGSANKLFNMTDTMMYL